jgi:hypothetical protein
LLLFLLAGFFRLRAVPILLLSSPVASRGRSDDRINPRQNFYTKSGRYHGNNRLIRQVTGLISHLRSDIHQGISPNGWRCCSPSGAQATYIGNNTLAFLTLALQQDENRAGYPITANKARQKLP